MALHPARTIPFPDLIAGLHAAQAQGLVHRKFEASTGLSLWVYSQRAVYERRWNQVTMAARGLILDEGAAAVIATPFPKFFNVGEQGVRVPDLPFQAFEKLDGSLIVAFHHAGHWRAVTKGAFDSAQADWAQRRMDAADLSPLVPGTTYLFEAVYPENVIVVRYRDPALVLLGAYDVFGRELGDGKIFATASALGWRSARRFGFASLADMVTATAVLPPTEEGYVIRFADGLRLKMKGAEYCRIHALVSRCTPLSVWEAMAAGDDLEAIRRDLPEEFWTDFDGIVSAVIASVEAVERRVAELAASVSHLSDKDLGLQFKSLPDVDRGYLFGFRRHGGLVGKARASVMRDLRPTGNVLPGYVPSYAVDRLSNDA